MTNTATIRLAGIGPVEINTDRKHVSLAGAIDINGAPVNVQKKRVYRNKKDSAIAARSGDVWLREIRPGVFMLIDDEDQSQPEPVRTGVYREVDLGVGVGPGGIFQDSYGENRVLLEEFK